MGHFGEIRLADPVFSAVVLPNTSNLSIHHPEYKSTDQSIIPTDKFLTPP